MKTKRAALIGITVLALIIGIQPALSQNENTVVMGRNFEKGQQGKRVLVFQLPQNWEKDEAGAKKAGLYGVLVPKGTKLENANQVITIAFQRKGNEPGLEDLKSFFKGDLAETLAQYPDAQFAKWQPAKLNPDKLSFMSMEMYGKKKDQPSPQRFVILDSGDGYYSVALTVATREELGRPIYEDFFNSIALLPEK